MDCLCPGSARSVVALAGRDCAGKRRPLRRRAACCPNSLLDPCQRTASQPTRAPPTAESRLKAVSLRAPRSPLLCARQATSVVLRSAAKKRRSLSGAHHKLTQPSPVLQAVCKARRVNCRCSRAAPCGPCAGVSDGFWPARPPALWRTSPPARCAAGHGLRLPLQRGR